MPIVLQSGEIIADTAQRAYYPAVFSQIVDPARVTAKWVAIHRNSSSWVAVAEAVEDQGKIKLLVDTNHQVRFHARVFVALR
jgi:hypothetical protein